MGKVPKKAITGEFPAPLGSERHPGSRLTLTVSRGNMPTCSIMPAQEPIVRDKLYEILKRASSGLLC